MTDIVNRLRTNRECLAPCLMDEAADEIVRLERVVLDLIAERDEARREIAHRVFVSGGLLPAEFAESRGWDFFKQDN
jgi:hypothetical protein